MAGMFYSLKEAAQRLSLTEDKVRELTKQGKLREFRDGPTLLFKVDEVDALVADKGSAAKAQAPKEAPPSPKKAVARPGPAKKPDEPKVPEPETTDVDMEVPELDLSEPTFAESASEGVGAGEIDLSEFLDLESQPATGPEPAEPDAGIPEPGTAEMEIPELETPEPQMPQPEAPAAKKPVTEPKKPQTAPKKAAAQPPAKKGQRADTGEILLAPETGAPLPPGELTDADTQVAGKGMNVLGETDQKDYEVTDDSLSETIGSIGLAGTTPEASLEEIESDVNLDTFGSGSGLLDLSLQADDTSLGGILDEIYTAEGAEAQAPAEAAGEGSVEEVVAEAETAPEEEFAGAAAEAQMVAVGAARFEPAPDTQSNLLGMLLFLPLIMVLYTAIVAVAGLKGVVPSILAVVQSFIWYIVIAAVVVALGVVGASFMIGRPAAPGAKKEKKASKAEKAPKAKKQKKGKGPAPAEESDLEASE
jgi:excisionase family DNA binding protein